MKDEKKQTAVEWLIQKLTNRQNGVFDGFPILTLDEIYKQAKEMEKQQMIDFAKQWEAKQNEGDLDTIEMLYNETYETKEM
jgi:hypothetical protein